MKNEHLNDPSSKQTASKWGINQPAKLDIKSTSWLICALFALAYLALGYLQPSAFGTAASLIYNALYVAFGAATLLLYLGAGITCFCAAMRFKNALINGSLLTALLIIIAAPFIKDAWLSYLHGFEWLAAFLVLLLALYFNSKLSRNLSTLLKKPSPKNEPEINPANLKDAFINEEAINKDEAEFKPVFEEFSESNEPTLQVSSEPASITQVPKLKPLDELPLRYGFDASKFLDETKEQFSQEPSLKVIKNATSTNEAEQIAEQIDEVLGAISIKKTPLSASGSTLESWEFNPSPAPVSAETTPAEPTPADDSQMTKIIYEDEPQSAGFLGAARKKVAITKELEENKALLADLEMADVAIRPKDFKLPPLELLTPPPAAATSVDERIIDEKISKLLAKLAQFKIDGDVVRTYTGPVVTTFEFKPAANVKLSKIAGLADDLAMELKATSIRIQAPIPGKDVVGIEIPNDESQTIYIRELFSDELFNKSKSKLTIALGKDIVGNSFITDLKKLPHLLIAGTTGSGKSVGINAMVLSLLYRNSPRTLRLLMIDPKMLEFSMYNDIPHLLVPVITRAEKATLALKNMVAEMERRYELMAQIRVKDIESFNEKCASCGLDAFAYIVIIIDELADLMMCAGKEVEVYIARLAQMARACGMHLIVATQRPSVDVITGLIKANLPSRLSYKVSTQMDSKVILDGRGAESLLGRGDSLFTPPGTSSIVRLHAPFSSEEEIIKVVEFLKEQEPPNYDESILSDASIARELTPVGEKDELYEDALRVMKEDGKTSISYLQRRLQIGYNRAANIIEQLEASGFLSAPNAKGVREIIG